MVNYTIKVSFARKYYREVVLLGCILTNISVWILVYSHKPSNLLHVYFLDIGQGDSILVDSPTHGRVLIDGGPDRRVLTELGRVLPFGDRRIDIVIESHPDADHVTGLVPVLENYTVGAFIEPGVESDNHVHVTLEDEVDKEDVPKLLARRGMVIDFHDGAKLVVLFPNTDVTHWETNDASIVVKLVYGNESFLLTGDSTKASEYKIMALGKDILQSTVLKAGHHGSKGSTSLLYAEAVAPQYAVISAGTDNTYGHPAKETLDVLQSVGAKVLATESAGGLAGMGTIEFETDGTNLVLK